MQTMYGKFIHCDTNIVECGCTYTPCQHSSDVLKRYASNLYGSESKLSKIIKILLDYQESTLETLCSQSIALSAIVQALGFKPCHYEYELSDCFTLCGVDYKESIFKCGCTPYQHDDTILLKLLMSTEFMKYPSRTNIKSICDIFGFGLIYSEQYINILLYNNNPAIYKCIIDMIPVPIGEKIRILTDC